MHIRTPIKLLFCLIHYWTDKIEIKTILEDLKKVNIIESFENLQESLRTFLGSKRIYLTNCIISCPPVVCKGSAKLLGANRTRSQLCLNSDLTQPKSKTLIPNPVGPNPKFEQTYFLLASTLCIK